MIVRLAADGVVVQDADDCTRLQVTTDLDPGRLRTALAATETGELLDGDTVLLDLAVLRSRAQLVASAPNWAERWQELTGRVEHAGQLSPDRRQVRVPLSR